MSDERPLVYDPVAKTIHWMTVLFVGLVLLSAMAMDEVSAGNMKKLVMAVHKSAGFLVLLITLFRIFWFTGHKKPRLPLESMPLWQGVAARYVHGGLYVLALVTPLIGLTIVAMGPYGFSFLGLVEIPLPSLIGFATAHPFWRVFVGVAHEAAATIFAGLIVLHVGATFMHHFVDRDDILFRISPECLHGWLSRLR